MIRLFHNDEILMKFLGYQQNSNTFLYPGTKTISSKKLKDKGQRKECLCVYSKDIGMYNTCPHLCVYCYANASKGAVIQNISLHNVDSEGII